MSLDQTMKVEEINAVLERESPDNVISQSYDARNQELVISFAWDGGPREDQAYIVHFEEVILFHLPAVFYGEIRFRKATEAERERLIPAESYDPLEVSGEDGAFTVVLFTDRKGKAIGYYVAAKSFRANWLPRAALLITL